jgi:hypothetical protein
VRTPAKSREDPPEVITPLDADALEGALREQGIFAEWAGVVDGVRGGFDVGVKEWPSRTITHPNHTSSKLDPSFIPTFNPRSQLVAIHEGTRSLSWRG